MENEDNNISLLNDTKNEFIYIPDYPNQNLTDDINKYKIWKNNLYSKYNNGAIYQCNNKNCKSLIFSPIKLVAKNNNIFCYNCQKYTCLMCNRVIISEKDVCCIRKILYNIKHIGIKYFNNAVLMFKFDEYYKIRRTFLYPYMNLAYLGIRIFNGFFFQTYHYNPYPYSENTIKIYYKDNYYCFYYLYYNFIVAITYIFLALPFFIYYYLFVIFFVILLNLFLHFNFNSFRNHYYQKAIFGMYAQCYNIRAKLNEEHLSL